ncbi:MAG: DNA methyltransferase [Spirochaetia bacterium]
MAAKGVRGRSGAFPFELAYRLINMFSVKGDLVLDPFVGSGTTILAAMCTGRNSVAETHWKIEYSLEAGLTLKL